MPRNVLVHVVIYVLLGTTLCYGQASRNQPAVKTADASPMHRKSVSATKNIKTPSGDFALWIDPAKWQQIVTTGDEPGRLEFRTINGQGYAEVTTARLGIPTDALPEIVQARYRLKAPNARVTLQEKRTVNGRQVLAMQLEGSMADIPFRYYGYFYGGTSGTIQVVTFTVSPAFDKNVAEFTKFLDGLEISDQDLPSSAGLNLTNNDPPPANSGARSKEPERQVINSGVMELAFDPKKWRQTEAKQRGLFEFEHTSGDAYAVVRIERIQVPMDSLPEFALANAKENDPNARISFREKRRVNGVEVWFLKLDTETLGIRLTFYGYYYGGESGTKSWPSLDAIL